MSNDDDAPNPGPTPDDLQAYLEALTELHTALIDADADATDEGENEIFELSNDVNNIITALGQAGIAANTNALQALGPNIDAVNKQLQNAQDEVSDWIKDAGTVATVVGVLDKAVKLGISVYQKFP